MISFKDFLVETGDARGYSFHFLPNTSDHEHTVVATHPTSKDTWNGEHALASKAYSKLPPKLRNKVVGVANIYHDNVETDDHLHQAHQVHGVGVHKQHRRKGVASAMYDHYEKNTGYDVIPSRHQSDDAEALWNSRRQPEVVNEATMFPEVPDPNANIPPGKLPVKYKR